MDEAATLAPPDERFSALYIEHAASLVAYCRRKVGPAEAEEVAQEAFLRAWTAWESYSPDRPFWPWLVTIARRVCIDRARRSATAAAFAHKAVSIFDGIPVVRPDEIVEAGEAHAWALAAVANLRPDQRRMLTRQAVDGWSYSEIARAEGVSEEAVRGALRRARLKLRSTYGALAGSTPVALPIAAFRWFRRRIATAPTFNFDMVRAGEAAFAAAAAIAIGMGPTSSAAAPATLPARPLASTSHAAAAPIREGAVPSAVAQPMRAATQQAAATPKAPVRVPPTAPARPTKVKVADLNTSDDELARHCAEADVKFRVGDHGACITSKKAVENAQILIDGGGIEP